jgi:hypothetical protein
MTVRPRGTLGANLTQIPLALTARKDSKIDVKTVRTKRPSMT